MSQLFPQVDQSRWSSIISAITTPLGLVTLLLLIFQVVILVAASFLQGSDRTILVLGVPLALLFLIVGVLFLAYKRPESLYGKRYDGMRTVSPVDNAGTNQVVQAELISLREELERFRSTKVQLWGILQQSRSFTVGQILQELHEDPSLPDARARVLAILGQLADEHKVEGDPTTTSSYRKTKSGGA